MGITEAVRRDAPDPAADTLRMLADKLAPRLSPAMRPAWSLQADARRWQALAGQLARIADKS